MKIGNDLNLYRVGEKVAEAGGYKLFLCIQEETGRQCLLQIATLIGSNGELDRCAYILGELKRCSDETEEEYAKVKKDPKNKLNYYLGFPELVDSFICNNQGGRRVNIFAFRSVTNVSNMIPLTYITNKYRLRVDLRTSGWIMGKALKIIDFAHSNGIAVKSTAGNNILIEKDNHYVLIFDWTDAQMYPGEIPIDVRMNDISQAAKAVITVLGGDWKKGRVPNDGEKAFVHYTNFLLRLARGSESNAQRAHANLYEIVDAFWKREFYPFTTEHLNEGE